MNIRYTLTIFNMENAFEKFLKQRWRNSEEEISRKTDLPSALVMMIFTNPYFIVSLMTQIVVIMG